ncbi:hypothetical protein Ddye_026535 [Dipteronia dyeriana]|uniref:25S rRNA (uridine-N(3))-methyltransferase BMT5-like domain-containing protein n=1 Tax=Dipteronia dyeriana TaxID=168575 RepID=A0AAD9TNF8_9ROSI|nr:hypothetical protein Ddye_026535 [Dipteronia dyeriana]
MAMATHQREEEVKWVNHYLSSHKILLVGEGDFSFSLSLALAFGYANNICASSLDSCDEVIKKYKNGKSNLCTLVNMGAFVLHRVNATKMKSHPDLQMRWFDRIVFNFPHAGFYGKEHNNHMIGMHRDLLNGFFENASTMLRNNGEVHVSHKTTPPYDSWNLKDLAFKNSLSLIEPAVEFKMEDYPGYSNKRGDFPRCDDHFLLGECSTFRFELSPAAKKTFNAKSCNGFPRRRCRQPQDFSIPFRKRKTSFDSRHMNAFTDHVGDNIAHVPPGFDSFGQPQRNVTRNMNDFPGHMGPPWTSDGYFNNVMETHGSHFTGFGRCMANAPGRMLNRDLSVSNKAPRLSKSTLRRLVRDYGA